MKANLNDILKVDEKRLILYLLSLGEGTHSCGWLKGYVCIERRKVDQTYTVMWTSSKRTHGLFSHPAISLAFNTGIIGKIFASEITMHPITDEAERKDSLIFLAKKILCAYRKKE